MKKAQETKNVKKSIKKSKVTLKHQILAYGLTIIVLTAYFYVLYVLHINSSLWTFLGAIVIAVIVLPVLQNVIYPKD